MTTYIPMTNRHPFIWLYKNSWRLAEAVVFPHQAGASFLHLHYIFEIYSDIIWNSDTSYRSYLLEILIACQHIPLSLEANSKTPVFCRCKSCLIPPVTLKVFEICQLHCMHALACNLRCIACYCGGWYIRPLLLRAESSGIVAEPRNLPSQTVSCTVTALLPLALRCLVSP